MIAQDVAVSAFRGVHGITFRGSANGNTRSVAPGAKSRRVLTSLFLGGAFLPVSRAKERPPNRNASQDHNYSRDFYHSKALIRARIKLNDSRNLNASRPFVLLKQTFLTLLKIRVDFESNAHASARPPRAPRLALGTATSGVVPATPLSLCLARL